MRLLALLLLVAVLPSFELAEQIEHVIVHIVDGDAPDHPAHHDDGDVGDEHGCTGLVHLCTCHHAQVTAAFIVQVDATIDVAQSPPALLPRDLIDLNSLEPPHRPPIA